MSGHAAIAAAFTQQSAWCTRLGSPFTATLLTLLAEDLGAGGPTAALAGAWPGDPVADALALRLAGALHALVLRGEVPALAACYPPHPTPGLDALKEAVRTALTERSFFIRAFLQSPPQTNEVGRSAVLLGGFLAVAADTRLPLYTLEIGASAGLNLLWDKYQYRLGDAAWGEPQSPVALAPAWKGALPPLSAPLHVAARAGCDIAPVDLQDNAQRLRLTAYVWADQRARLGRLQAAIDVARSAGIRVAQADASEWVEARLADPAPGHATVLYHSIMWQYMPEATRARIAASIADAGGRATPTAPLAWLRFEPPADADAPELHLTAWPGGHLRVLAKAHPHGNAIHWLEP